MFYTIKLGNEKTLTFNAKNVSPSGCSSTVCLTTSGLEEDHWQTETKSVPIRKFIEVCGFGSLARKAGNYDTITMGIVGVMGVMAPRIAHELRWHEYVWVMNLGGDTAGVFTSSSAPERDLAQGMFDLPYYLIDPQNMASMEGLFEMGVYRHSVTRNRTSLPPLEPPDIGDSVEFDSPINTTEAGPQIVVSKVALYDSSYKYSNRAAPIELCPERGNTPPLPWWEEKRLLGERVLHSHVLIERLVELTWGTGTGFPRFTFIAGNYGTIEGMESIRMVTYLQSLIEEDGWRFDKPRYLTIAGNKVYYNVIPFIYKSSYHDRHHVACAMLSTLPITFTRGSEYEPV